MADDFIGDPKTTRPAKKGRRAAKTEEKETPRESAVFKEEADEEVSIDLFDSHQSNKSGDNVQLKPSKRGGWGNELNELGSKGRKSHEGGDYEDERLKESSHIVDDDSDTDIPAIPELEDEVAPLAQQRVDIAAAPQIAVNRVATYKELDSDLILHTGFLSLKFQDGEIDLKLLGEALSGENNVREDDVVWELDHIFTEVSSELSAEAENRDRAEE